MSNNKCLRLRIHAGHNNMPPVSLYVCEGTPKSRRKCSFYEPLGVAKPDCRFYDSDMGAHPQYGGFCTRPEAQLVAHE